MSTELMWPSRPSRRVFIADSLHASKDGREEAVWYRSHTLRASSARRLRSRAERRSQGGSTHGTWRLLRRMVPAPALLPPELAAQAPADDRGSPGLPSDFARLGGARRRFDLPAVPGGRSV